MVPSTPVGKAVSGGITWVTWDLAAVYRSLVCVHTFLFRYRAQLSFAMELSTSSLLIRGDVLLPVLVDPTVIWVVTGYIHRLVIYNTSTYMCTNQAFDRNVRCYENALPPCSLWRWGRSVSLTGRMPACSGRRGRRLSDRTESNATWLATYIR